MAKRVVHIGLILTFFFTSLKAQVEVYDVGFGQYLCDSFPSLMSSDCKTLDTIQAQSITASLNFNYREIDTVPEIKYFIRAAFIDGANNNIKYYPNFTTEHKFDRLEFAWNQLTAIPDVAGRENEILGLWLNRNDITSIQGLEKFLNLDAINLFSNPFSDLSYMKDLTELNNVTLGKNDLTFKDLSWMISYPDGENIFNLFNMNDVEVENKTVNKFAFTTHTFTMPIDSSVQDLKYYWYKDNVLKDSTNTNSYSITSLNEEDSGFWHVEWKINSNLSELNKLVMKSKPWELTVSPCQEILDLDVTMDVECEGANFTLQNYTLTNQSTDFEFILLNTFTDESKLLLKDELISVPHGVYAIYSTDSAGCSVKTDENFISSRPLTSCDRYFTPNEDGDNDKFYIDFMGPLKVYNSLGVEVKSLDGPCYWDGKSQDNSLLTPDVYLIRNEHLETIKVTLIY